MPPLKLAPRGTGTAHIVYALDTPSVTIYGGTHPGAYAPPAHGTHLLALHDVPCRPRDGKTCTVCAYDYACLDGVTVEQVLALSEQTEWRRNGCCA